MNRNWLLPEYSERSARPALPADLAAVQADDALLDALRGPNPSPKGDAWLMKALTAWRDEVDTEPLPRLVDVDTALAVVARAQPPVGRSRSLVRTIGRFYWTNVKSLTRLIRRATWSRDVEE